MVLLIKEPNIHSVGTIEVEMFLSYTPNHLFYALLTLTTSFHTKFGMISKFFPSYEVCGYVLINVLFIQLGGNMPNITFDGFKYSI